MKIQENGEAMVALSEKDFVLEPLYFEWNLAKDREIKLREGVVKRLMKIQKKLKEKYLSLKVWDGFRTLETQNLLYNCYKMQLEMVNPSWDQDQIKSAVEVFVSYPSHDKDSPAPHNTGGAVDLTIIDLSSGKELPMGTEFDEFNARSYTDHFDSGMDIEIELPEALREWQGYPFPTKRPYPFSKEEIMIFQKNRRLLLDIMEGEGFVNYEGEWWHFSYGDRTWAEKTGQNFAIYGSVEL